MDIMQRGRKQKLGILSGLSVLLWSLTVFCYFFQVPYRRLASYIVPCLAVFLICSSLKKGAYKLKIDWIKIFACYIVYLCLMVILSLIKGYAIGNIIRFLLILTVIPLFAVIKIENFDIEEEIFLFLAVAKSIMLIYLAVQVLRAGSHYELRSWALTNDYGDIYLYRGVPRVQLHGNGILPIAFIINFYVNKERKAIKYIITLIVGLGILAAGNVAFFLGVGLFCGYQLIKLIRSKSLSGIKRMFFLLILIIGAGIFAFYAVDMWKVKAGYSNIVRLEQAKALMDNYLIIGNGLGSEVVVSGIRNTRGEIYFELQTLYIFNQIGAIGLALFYFVVFSAVYKRGKENLIIFLIYLAYTFWNPYCFDSTEMMTLCLVNALPMYRRE